MRVSKANSSPIKKIVILIGLNLVIVGIYSRISIKFHFELFFILAQRQKSDTANLAP